MENQQFASLKKSDLTIITLTYNSSRYIEKCIRSIVRACQNISLRVCHLVIDGKSEDDTVNIIRKLSPSSLIIDREPAGIYEALNYAVSLVESSYLMYVHSDDEIDEYFLRQMFQRINNLDPCQNYILYGTVDFIDEGSNTLFSRYPPFYVPFVQRQILIIFHPNAIYSTALEKTHPYQLDQGLIADKQHITDIASKAKLIRVPSAKYRFRMSQNSSTMRELVIPKKRKFFSLSLPALYITLFETKIIRRLIMKLNGQSYWSGYKQ